MLNEHILRKKIALLKEVYFPLIYKYLKREISFEVLYVRYEKVSHNDPYVVEGRITEIKNRITGDIKITYDDPDPEDSAEIGEEELRKNLAENLKKLEKIVADYENKQTK